MMREPIRLLESSELSVTERSLLEAGRSVPPVHCDVAAGAARFRASLDALALAPAPPALGPAKLIETIPWVAGMLLPVLALCAVYWVWRAQQSEPVTRPPPLPPVSAASHAPPPAAALPDDALAPAPTLPSLQHPAPPRRDPRRKGKYTRASLSPPSAAGAAPAATPSDPNTLEELLERPRTAMRAASPAAEKPAALAEPAPAGEVPHAGDELHDIARARAWLRSDPQAALDLLNRVGREHPHGYFVEERLALTILALAATGQHDLAESRAANFLRAYPKSPFADRVRAAVSR
jgi:hypothetical protein